MKPIGYNVDEVLFRNDKKRGQGHLYCADRGCPLYTHQIERTKIIVIYRNTSSSMLPDSEVKAVWTFEMRLKADSATLASYAESLIARTMFCKSPEDRDQDIRSQTFCRKSKDIREIKIPLQIRIGSLFHCGSYGIHGEGGMTGFYRLLNLCCIS